MFGRNQENSNTIISIFPFKNPFSATLTHRNVNLWALKVQYLNILILTGAVQDGCGTVQINAFKTHQSATFTVHDYLYFGLYFFMLNKCSVMSFHNLMLAMVFLILMRSTFGTKKTSYVSRTAYLYLLQLTQQCAIICFSNPGHQRIIEFI